MTEEEFIALVLENEEIKELLAIVENLKLKEGCLCAGVIRNYVWNRLSNQSTYIGDVDVIFFDETVSYETALGIEKQLLSDYPDYQWEVRNQAHMHKYNGATEPYTSVTDALSKFPEKCTAIGLRKLRGAYELIVPFGIEDVVNFIVQPTPYFMETKERMSHYQLRREKKQWDQHWQQVRYL